MILWLYIVWQFILLSREIQEVENGGFRAYITRFWNGLEVSYFIAVALMFYAAYDYYDCSKDMVSQP